MKQHITVEQFNELSKKGKKTFWEWINSRRWMAIPEGKGYLDYFPMPLLSIGQMIEFLDEHGYAPNITKYKKGTKIYSTVCTTDCYEVFLYWGDSGNLDQNIVRVKKELCDALWSAVKDILEKENK